MADNSDPTNQAPSAWDTIAAYAAPYLTGAANAVGIGNDKETQDSIQPEGSPIDLLAAGAAGPLMDAGAAAIDAAPSVLGNEIGALGPGAKPLGYMDQAMAKQQMEDAYTAHAAAPTAQTAAELQNAVNVNGRMLARTPTLGIRPRRMAEGGDVQPEQGAEAPDAPAAPTEAAPQSVIPPTETPVYDLSSGKPVLGSVPHSQVTDAVASGQYSLPQGQVNVLNPDGVLGTIDAAQAADAFKSGYKYASPDDIAQDTYGKQPGTAFAEGIARGVAGPLATGFEKHMLHVPDADILGREKANPIASGVGEGAGLVGGALTGTGEAALAEHLGQGALGAANVANAATPVAKIGSAAVKAAVENAFIQGNDEASKMILGDPDTSVGHALMATGISGAIGGTLGAGLGAISPLWKAAMGTKTGEILNSIADRAGGIDGVPNKVQQDIQDAGLADKIPASIRASYSDNPVIVNEAQALQDSTNGPALKYQEDLKSYRGMLSDAALASVGRTPEDLSNLTVDANASGVAARDAIANKIKSAYEPIKNSYEQIANKFKDIEVPQDLRSEAAESLGKIALDSGMSPASEQSKFLQRVIGEFGDFSNNLESFRKYTSSLGKETSGINKQDLWSVAGQIRGVLNGVEEKALGRAVQDQAPELYEQHLATNSQYKALKNTVSGLNDRLSVGKFNGPGGFIKQLGQMDGEAVLRRLDPTNKADIIQEIGQHFPEAAQAVKDYHLNNLLKKAQNAAGEGESINTRTLLKSVQDRAGMTGAGMSPQMRQFVLGDEAHQKLQTIGSLLDGIPERVGKSGTPKGIMQKMGDMMTSATAMTAAAVSHNPIMGILTGILGKAAAVTPDYARYALLKFLGSNREVSGTGFKAAVDFISKAAEGQTLLQRGAKAIFTAGREVLPSKLIPTDEQKEKLDKNVDKMQANQSHFLDIGGDIGHYMPEHAGSLAGAAGSAVQYLAKIKPTQPSASPFDKNQVPNPVAKGDYDKALTIACSPLSVLPKIKDGTLTQNDVMHLSNLCPAAYNSMKTKVYSEMMDQLGKGNDIPYRQRLSISLFLGNNLDSTMSPGSIQAAQSVGQPQEQPGTPTQPQQNPKRSTASLSKMPKMYQTPGQAGQERRSGKE